MLLVGLDDAPSGTRENYDGALTDINGVSAFTQPSLKIFKLWLQVADGQRLLAGSGYDHRVVHVQAQLAEMRVRGISLTYRLKITGDINPFWGMTTRVSRGGILTVCKDLRTSYSWGRMRLYGLCERENWGALPCIGHLSRWCERLWPRRGIKHRFPSFHRNSWLFFQKICQLQARSMPGSKPKLHLASVRVRLIHVRS